MTERTLADATADIVGREYRWASSCGAHSMPHPEELLYLGYAYVERNGERVRDPRYGSWLMARRG